MSMSHCIECGQFIEDYYDHYRYIEPHGEEVIACPHCGSVNLENARYCDLCGAPSVEFYCPECQVDLCDRLHREFSPQELEALDHLYDGRFLSEKL